MRNKILIILILVIATAFFNSLPTVKAVTKTITLYPVADTFVFEMYPNNNYGNYQDMIVGIHENGNRYRILIKFSLSGIPSNAQIVSAKLIVTLRSLHFFDVGGTTLKKIYVRRLTSSWSENTATWNNQPSHQIASGPPYFEVSHTDSAGKKYEVYVTDLLKTGLKAHIQTTALS